MRIVEFITTKSMNGKQKRWFFKKVIVKNLLHMHLRSLTSEYTNIKYY